MDMIDAILKWVVAPLAAFAGLLYRTQQAQATEIAILRTLIAANKDAHDREFSEMKSSFKQVIDKLDSIEAYLRK